VIAALFVAKGGCYFGLPGVDPWDEQRDARLYAGPWPVVAHPPCARWGRYWFGGPGWKGPRKVKGDDGGCFASALASVRRWGGVLEHPAQSAAWAAFSLNRPPVDGGWVVADWVGGWTAHIEQGAYGHRARKATWLYACGVGLPSLQWGRPVGVFASCDKGFRRDSPAPRDTTGRRLSRTGIVQMLSARQRAATPIPFRDLLLSIAASSRVAEVA
jgi:hypothetical protein